MCDFPGGAGGRAGACTTVGKVAAITSWCGGVREGVLEVGEAGCLRDAVTVDLDETVSTSFFRVLVNEAATVDVGHLSVVESSDFLEGTLIGDATIFGKAGQ